MTRWDVHKYARQAYEIGIRYIGGCCGFEPYHIRAIAEEVCVVLVLYCGLCCKRYTLCFAQGCMFQESTSPSFRRTFQMVDFCSGRVEVLGFFLMREIYLVICSQYHKPLQRVKRVCVCVFVFVFLFWGGEGGRSTLHSGLRRTLSPKARTLETRKHKSKCILCLLR